MKIQNILESLSRSAYKDIKGKLSDSWKPIYNEYNKMFGSNKRIYIPVGHDMIKSKISAVMQDLGFRFDYKKGLAWFRDGRETTIGKVLSRKHGDLLDEYVASSDYAIDGEDVSVVISRHPYDIASASVDREWDSCINVNNVYGHRLPAVISDGCLIAYLVKSGDTSIENPLARILIYRYNSITDDSYMLVPGKQHVASRYSHGRFRTFDAAIKQWCDDNGSSDGVYTIKDDIANIDSMSSVTWYDITMAIETCKTESDIDKVIDHIPLCKHNDIVSSSNDIKAGTSLKLRMFKNKAIEKLLSTWNSSYAYFIDDNIMYDIASNNNWFKGKMEVYDALSKPVIDKILFNHNDLSILVYLDGKGYDVSSNIDEMVSDVMSGYILKDIERPLKIIIGRLVSGTVNDKNTDSMCKLVKAIIDKCPNILSVSLADDINRLSTRHPECDISISSNIISDLANKEDYITSRMLKGINDDYTNMIRNGNLISTIMKMVIDKKYRSLDAIDYSSISDFMANHVKDIDCDIGGIISALATRNVPNIAVLKSIMSGMYIGAFTRQNRYMPVLIKLLPTMYKLSGITDNNIPVIRVARLAADNIIKSRTDNDAIKEWLIQHPKLLPLDVVDKLKLI